MMRKEGSGSFQDGVPKLELGNPQNRGRCDRIEDMPYSAFLILFAYIFTARKNR